MFSKLLLLFIIIPVIELYLFIKIGDAIGVLATFSIIIITAVLGASLARQQGRLALMKFQEAAAAGRMPHEEVMDGIMILIAAVVLVTPGFFTDAIGFALLIPPVRTFARKFIGGYLKNHIRVIPTGATTAESPAQESTSKHIGRDEKIIDAEVIDD